MMIYYLILGFLSFFSFLFLFLFHFSFFFSFSFLIILLSIEKTQLNNFVNSNLWGSSFILFHSLCFEKFLIDFFFFLISLSFVGEVLSNKTFLSKLLTSATQNEDLENYFLQLLESSLLFVVSSSQFQTTTDSSQSKYWKSIYFSLLFFFFFTWLIENKYLIKLQ